MDRAPNLHKKALIALLNEKRAQRAAVRVEDTVFRTIDGETRLILKFSDGTESEFKGLHAA